MISTTLRWTKQTGWTPPLSEVGSPIDLILYFGGTDVLSEDNSPWKALRAAYPAAVCAGCSSAGEIEGVSVSDGEITAALVSFADSKVRGAAVTVSSAEESGEAGRELGRRLAEPELCHVLVLSDGLAVNGTTLTTGLRETLPQGVWATGGLAGDGARFQKTLVGLGDKISGGQVVGIGFYGTKLKALHGSAGGWEAFGPTRLITHSVGNVLYKLDDQPALAVYKRYLGELAEKLPASGLLFPLELLAERTAASGLVRTILAVNEANQSLTFAGDLPQGQYARFMKAGCDALVDGADQAANKALGTAKAGDCLAVLVSCVGRKLVMGQRVEEEVEAVVSRLGTGAQAVGFYSYGEICPTGLAHGCDLHNQTMTLTVLSESA